MKKQVQATELDFNKKYEIYTRVEAAKKKIEENNKLLAETLRPNLNKANQNYNAFKPGYDKAVNEMEQRLSLISKLDFTLIGKDPAHGLDTLAQELKTKSEEGYDFSNDISFYKTYIQNYIGAKGDLANNKQIYSTSSSYLDDIVGNTKANPSNYAIAYNFIGVKGGNSTSVGKQAIGFGTATGTLTLAVTADTSYHFNGTYYYMNEKTATLSKEELDAWTEKKAQLSQKGLEVINGLKSIFVDETTKQGFKDKLQAHLDYADNIYHAKYEQHCYNEAKAAGNETEALTHLQKKVEYENKAQAIVREWQGPNGKDVEVKNHYFNTKEAWKKANIDDIENSNTLAVNTLKKQYLAALEAQKRKLAELQGVINQAKAAVEAKERENRQLQPTPEDIEEAKKAEALKQKLEAEKQALKEALEKLKLNDLTDVGTNALAHGTNALVTGKNAIGIGTDELVTGEDSIGIGRKNTVSGTQSVAIGTENTVSGNNSGAMGTNNSVLSDNSFAIGKNNSINKEAKNNFILGNEVIISDAVSNSVVLGDGSTLSAPAKVGEVTPYGVVSVGATGKERQIQNVAAGGKDTDAVNVAQLKAVDKKVDTNTTNINNIKQNIKNLTQNSGSGVHYFSVNSDDKNAPDGTNYNNDGATGRKAIAIGRSANATKSNSTALGYMAAAQSEDSVAIGTRSKALVNGSVALGKETVADREAGKVGYIALGGSATFEEALVTLNKKEDYDNWTRIIDASKAEYDRLTKAYFDANSGDKAAAKAALDAWKGQHRDFVAALEAKSKLEATWKAGKGAVSVGRDSLDDAGNRVIATRQITGLAAGTEDTDAVNVAQLKALNTKVDKGAVHYFSVKSDDSANPAGTNWNNDGATGQSAIAIGRLAQAKGDLSTALGTSAKAQEEYSTALGTSA
ncbi:MAG: hypothetical protein ACLTM5_06435, partial [Dialister sp.]